LRDRPTDAQIGFVIKRLKEIKKSRNRKPTKPKTIKLNHLDLKSQLHKKSMWQMARQANEHQVPVN
jgi:hypothetical protein